MMQYIFMLLLAGGIVAADQLTKLWVLRDIPLYGNVPVIPGVFSLTYIQNRGAAWGSFQGMIWLFAIIFALFTIGVIWEFSKKRMPFKTFDRWCIAAIWAGGLGNMIDRIRMGFVVDMIKTDFMDFPIFNVADCFITCGCIALIVSLVFFNKDFWKDEKKQEEETEGTEEE
jgi:signal peptidase II